MADEQKTEVTETSTQEKTFTQAEVDRLISQRLEREKSKFTDYDEVKKKAETLEAKIKEREEAEMSELEKIKKQSDDYKKEIEQLSVHKEWRTNWEEQEKESINALMEDFEEDTKEIINALPLEKRRTAIAKFKASSSNPNPSTEKGIKKKSGDIPTLEEVQALRKEKGVGHPDYRKAYQVYQNARMNGLI